MKCPDGMNMFEFSVLAGLRAAQLSRGCTPRVERSGKVAVTAQREIAERKIVRVWPAASPDQAPVSIVERPDLVA